MDLDWCLSCGRRIDQDSPSVYCSRQCQAKDGPTVSISDEESMVDDEDVVYHQVHPVITPKWFGSGPEGIAAWAQDIPHGSPAGAPSPSEFLPPPSQSPLKSLRPPRLLIPSHRPIPPTLCMTVPSESHPSTSPTTHRQHISTTSSRHRYSGESSSATSFLTESIHTPPSLHPPHAPFPIDVRKSSVLGTLATQVRSWVSPSTPSQHFPKTSPSSRRNPPLSSSVAISVKHISPTPLYSPSDEPGTVRRPQFYLSTADLGGKPKRSRRYTASAMNHDIPARVDHPAFLSRGRKVSRVE